MQQDNIPPFYPGQKVAILVSTPLAKEGDVFTVKSIWKFCCVWLVDIGLVCPATHTRRCNEHSTPLHLVKGEMMPVQAEVLTPVHPDFQSITLTEVIKIESPLISVN